MNDVDENFNYASGGNDDEQFIQNEKLKEELRKSLLVEVGKIVEHEKNSEQGAFETLDDEKLQIDKSVVHALTECLFQHAGTMTKDMFAFAKHAKRVNINQDDVKLLFRRREDLLRQIEKVEIIKKRKSKSNNNNNNNNNTTTTTTTTTTKKSNNKNNNNNNNYGGNSSRLRLNKNMTNTNKNNGGGDGGGFIDEEEEDELFY